MMDFNDLSTIDWEALNIDFIDCERDKQCLQGKWENFCMFEKLVSHCDTDYDMEFWNTWVASLYNKEEYENEMESRFRYFLDRTYVDTYLDIIHFCSDVQYDTPLNEDQLLLISAAQCYLDLRMHTKKGTINDTNGLITATLKPLRKFLNERIGIMRWKDIVTKPANIAEAQKYLTIKTVWAAHMLSPDAKCSPSCHAGEEIHLHFSK